MTLGLGACQFMLSADMLLARSRFEANPTGLYSLAGVAARGLVLLTGPIVAVMFPKVVRSLATSEPSNALRTALRSTAVLATGVARGAPSAHGWRSGSWMRIRRCWW